MSSPERLRVPVQTRSQRTRRALVRAAWAEFDRRGYALTTAKSIAERARVGTGTFYHYFPDKDAVLREITLERVQFLMNQVAPLTTSPSAPSGTQDLFDDARQRLGGVVRLYVDYHRSDRGLHTVISERRLCDPALDEVMTRAEHTAVKQLGSTLRQWGHGGDTEAVAFMMFSLLEGAVHAHVLGKPVVSDTRFEAALSEALLNIGLGSAPRNHDGQRST